MILAVDTNILLDILIPDSHYCESSLRCLTNVSQDDVLIVSEIVFAELACQFPSVMDINRFLYDTGIKLVQSDQRALFEASRAWKIYLSRKKLSINCPHCGRNQKITCHYCEGEIPFRQHIVTDFLIAAHAKVLAERFITRDRGFYRTYFNDLSITDPMSQ